MEIDCGWGTNGVVVQQVTWLAPRAAASGCVSLAAIEILDSHALRLRRSPPSFPSQTLMPSSSGTPQRRSWGFGPLVLVSAGLAAAVGIAVWYLRGLEGGTSNWLKSRTKKSVVVVLDNVSVSFINMDPVDTAAVYRQETAVVSRVPGVR